ncbi:MAG: protein-disulfide reductase DsbD family protein [Proteobacteria bacterium]|nr:protein-disulfide reductase DsbD family protein [Pseudomonadota bacterium]
MSSKFRNCSFSGLAVVALAVSIMAAPLAIGPVRAETASGAWQGTEEAAARLIAGQSRVDGAGRIWLGVQIKLGSGWKTYWRSPGESGAPPRLDWSASDNLDMIEVRWPAPQRFSAFGFDSFGYHDEVVLPVLLKLAAPAQPATARLSLDYLICAQVCIPIRAELALGLPAILTGATGTKAEPSAFAPLIRRYLDRVPQPESKAGLNIKSAVVSGPPGKQILHITGHSEVPFAAPDLMVEGPEPFGFGRPKTTYGAGRQKVTMALPVYAGTGKAKLATQALTLTMVDGPRAVERRVILGQ